MTGAAGFAGHLEPLPREALGCGDYQATAVLADVLTGVGEMLSEPWLRAW